MARRLRSDSVSGRTEIVQGAIGGAPRPPKGVGLSNEVKPFWNLVTQSKAKRAWTEHDLVLAADVARSMHRLEVLAEKLDRLYDEVIDEPSSPEEVVLHEARMKAIKEWEKISDATAKRVRMLSVHLQIHPEATQGKAGMQRAQNQTHHEALQESRASEDDDLLAKPVH